MPKREPLSSELLRITVRVTSQGKLAYEGDIDRDKQISITSPFAAIAFTLEGPSGPSDQVAFASTPLLWVDNKEWPIDGCPAAMQVHRESDRAVTLVDLHCSDANYHFHTVVFYRGKIITSEDPTIINKSIPE